MSKYSIVTIGCWCLMFVFSFLTCIVYHSVLAGLTSFFALLNVVLNLYRIFKQKK